MVLNHFSFFFTLGTVNLMNGATQVGIPNFLPFFFGSGIKYGGQKILTLGQHGTDFQKGHIQSSGGSDGMYSGHETLCNAKVVG